MPLSMNPPGSDPVALAAQRIRASMELKRELLEQAEDIAAAAGLVVDTLSAGGRVLFCGNGGSAADAQHLAAELQGRFKMDRRALAGVALTVNTSTLTAVANDYGYDLVFARQVEALGHRGDLLVGLSTSGDSANVVEAVRTARAAGLRTLALTGRRGGKLLAEAETCLRMPSDDVPRIQEGHILVGHILCEIAEYVLCGGPDA
jgi:D-sedoheptulose 7-phosphate isomerase